MKTTEKSPIKQSIKHCANALATLMLAEIVKTLDAERGDDDEYQYDIDCDDTPYAADYRISNDTCMPMGIEYIAYDKKTKVYVAVDEIANRQLPLTKLDLMVVVELYNAIVD